MSFKNILFIFCILIHSEQLQALSQKHFTTVSDFLKKYTRPVTILEVTTQKADYTCTLAEHYNAIYVALVLKDSSSTLSHIQSRNYKNSIVLSPQNFSLKDAEMLSRCEHFDVVIIHDIYSYIKSDIHHFIEHLTKLGDHTFFEVPITQANIVKELKNKRSQIVSIDTSLLFLHSYQKKGLDIPRWTTKDIPISSQPRYTVISTFNEKTLYKNTSDQPSTWLPGINLKTFVMLRGIYPTDAIIRQQFLTIKDTIPYHNDFIIGNIIIQGHTIVPIDFDDRRRNANMHKWIKRALELFNGDNSRLKNPTKRVDQYMADS